MLRSVYPSTIKWRVGKYCKPFIKQKGVDEDEISVSIRGEISFDSYLRCFQENTVGLMRSGTYEIEAVSLTMY